jgi:hypothetical protein
LLLDPKPILTTDEINPSSYGSPRSKSNNPYIDKFSKTDSDAMAKIVK